MFKEFTFVSKLMKYTKIRRNLKNYEGYPESRLRFALQPLGVDQQGHLGIKRFSGYSVLLARP